MTYHVTLVESEEGFAVWCDDLPGCNSQGATREEALENIRIAIGEYLAAQPGPGLQSVLARVSRAKKSASSSMPKLPGVNHLAAVRAFEKIGFIVRVSLSSANHE